MEEIIRNAMRDIAVGPDDYNIDVIESDKKYLLTAYKASDCHYVRLTLKRYFDIQYVSEALSGPYKYELTSKY